MTVEYTPTDALPNLETLQIPENGELLSHANLIKSGTATAGPLAKLIDAAYYLSRHIASGALTELQGLALSFSNITVSTGQSYKVSSRVEERWVSLNWQPVGAASTMGVQSDGSIVDTATGAGAVSEILIPHGCTLNAVDVSINPAGGHGALPSPRPGFIVTSQDPATGITTTIATGVDAPADVPAYEAIHNLSATGLSVAIDRSAKIYKIYLTGEFGGDAENNLVIYGAAKLTVTRTKVGED